MADISVHWLERLKYLWTMRKGSKVFDSGMDIASLNYEPGPDPAVDGSLRLTPEGLYVREKGEWVRK